MAGNDNEFLGKASLWTSILGIVLPTVLAIQVAIFLQGAPPEPLDEKVPFYAMCGLLFVILELVAVACGIAARRTAAGKAGLVISGVVPPVLVLVIALLGLWEYVLVAAGRLFR